MKTSPASSRQLLAFAMDVESELMQTGLFSRVTCKKTGMPKCALVVTCTLKNEAAKNEAAMPAAISALLERLWKESLADQGSDYAFRMMASPERVTLEFATGNPRVTGCIEVSGFHRASVLKVIQQ